MVALRRPNGQRCFRNLRSPCPSHASTRTGQPPAWSSPSPPQPRNSKSTWNDCPLFQTFKSQPSIAFPAHPGYDDVVPLSCSFIRNPPMLARSALLGSLFVLALVLPAIPADSKGPAITWKKTVL